MCFFLLDLGLIYGFGILVFCCDIVKCSFLFLGDELDLLKEFNLLLLFDEIFIGLIVWEIWSLGRL